VAHRGWSESSGKVLCDRQENGDRQLRIDRYLYAWSISDGRGSAVEEAAAWMSDEGAGADADAGRSSAAGLLRQPLSGIPYKVFALRAADHVALPSFVAMSVVARGLRIVGVAAIFAGGGVAPRSCGRVSSVCS